MFSDLFLFNARSVNDDFAGQDFKQYQLDVSFFQCSFQLRQFRGRIYSTNCLARLSWAKVKETRNQFIGYEQQLKQAYDGDAPSFQVPLFLQYAFKAHSCMSIGHPSKPPPNNLPKPLQICLGALRAYSKHPG